MGRILTQPRQRATLSRASFVLSVLLLSLTASLNNVADADDGYRLPWTPGVPISIAQGWGTGTHNGTQMSFAYDFALPEGAPILASKSGVVFQAVGTFSDCGGPEFANLGNRVTINHDDGTSTLYLHLQSVSVTNGQTVVQGQQIGLSGKTGWTATATGSPCYPHLHFQRQAQGSWITNSTAVYFDEYPGQQLSQGMVVTSQNGQSPTTPTPRALGVPNLDAWCKYKGYARVVTVAPNAYGLRCERTNGEKEHFSVLEACKYQFSNPGAVDSYRDFNNAYNWECYDLGPSLGKPNLSNYCSQQMGGTLHLSRPDAYGIYCIVNGQTRALSVTQACRWQFNRQDVIDSIRNFYDPENWLCYIIK